jgi:F0F1-type ATP synthase gamma subunit
MRSQKFLRDELRFMTEFSTLFDVIQQTAVAQLHRADEQRARQWGVAEVLARDYFPLLPPEAQDAFLVRGGAAGRLVVAVTSDEGLVGPLHAGVIRKALEDADATAHWILVGQRGRRLLGSQARLRVMPMPADDEAEQQMRRLARSVIAQYGREQLRDAWLVAPHYLSAARQTIVVRPLLPLPIGMPAAGVSPHELVVEPSLRQVVELLAAWWVEAVCLESLWSARRAEFAARALHMERSRQDLAKRGQRVRYEFFKQLHGRVDVMVRETCVVQRVSASRRTAQGAR